MGTTMSSLSPSIKLGFPYVLHAPINKIRVSHIFLMHQRFSLIWQTQRQIDRF